MNTCVVEQQYCVCPPKGVLLAELLLQQGQISCEGMLAIGSLDKAIEELSLHGDRTNERDVLHWLVEIMSCQVLFPGPGLVTIFCLLESAFID